MEDLNDCSLRETSSTRAANCYDIVMNMEQKARMLKTYWKNAVDFTGGLEGTKNRSERDSFQNAEWVLEGTREGLYKLFEDRFTEEGLELDTCFDKDGVKYWGTACTDVITAYKAHIKIGDLPIYDNNAGCFEGGGEDGEGDIGDDGEAADPDFATHANHDFWHTCYEDDDITLNDGAFGGERADGLCTCVPKDNGLWQYVWQANVTCVDPITSTRFNGIDSCVEINGVW